MYARVPSLIVLHRCFTVFLLFGLLAVAQTAPPQAPAPQTTPKTNKEGTTNDRIFGMLPNYQTVENAKTLPPLTAKQKYTLAVEGSFDPVEFGFVGVLAGLNQVSRENPSWGYGFGGYAKRYGEAFANQTIENLMVNGTMPALLHQDPRYYEFAQGSYWKRFVYAADRLAITRGDSGHAEFNASEFGGSLAAAGISNAYEPAGSRTVGNTMEVWGTQLLIDGLSNEMREFWPDIKHKVFRHKWTVHP